MQTPLQITFRNMDASPTLEERVREAAGGLDKFHPKITSCRVVVETRHHHQHKGNLCHVRIDLRVPGAELVVGREGADKQAHEDPYVAVRDAFDAMRRQLQEHLRIARGKVKRHAGPDDAADQAAPAV